VKFLKRSSRALPVLSVLLAACGGASDNTTGSRGDPPGSGSIVAWGACEDCPGTPVYLAASCTNGDNLELRLCKDGHQFASIITTAAGALAIRPHPGNDPNGWGSSLYLQAFLADTAALTGASAIVDRATGSGITVSGSGAVNGAGQSRYGSWSWTLTFAYDADRKTVSTSTGSYTVSLDGPLANRAADLNLARISSNYLHEVPLLDPPGSSGDTGDMQEVKITGEQSGLYAAGLAYDWIPPDAPSFYPSSRASRMSIDVVGQHNLVDTLAQGLGSPITPAWKPSVTLSIASQDTELPMIFGAAWDTSQAANFDADNVGVAPIVLRTWTQTAASFEVSLVSTALPGDP